MAKQFYIQFGTGNPQSYAGLTPTLTLFRTQGATNITGPLVTEVGVSSGLYQFTYAPAATYSIVFTADGGSALADSDRYVTGVLDPVAIVDQRIGDTPDSFGSTSTDPGTLFGYAKRSQEVQEGNATFNKSTGVWDIYSRGSSTLLAEKTLTNSVSSVTKS